MPFTAEHVDARQSQFNNVARNLIINHHCEWSLQDCDTAALSTFLDHVTGAADEAPPVNKDSNGYNMRRSALARSASFVCLTFSNSKV
jgi:hypothetical protein